MTEPHEADKYGPGQEPDRTPLGPGGSIDLLLAACVGDEKGLGSLTARASGASLHVARQAFLKATEAIADELARRHGGDGA